ncbi:Exocyst complex component SEC15B [Linum grandiflorum]
MLSTKHRRKVAPANGDANDNSADKQEQLLLFAAIYNGEDLGPFIRKVFATTGKPEILLHNLRHFVRSKESEIEEVCKAHYQDFILAVDDLRSLLSDVDSLKSALSDSNSQLQSVAGPLLTSLDSFIEAQTISHNVYLALTLIVSCIKLMELCSRANNHMSSGNLYMALRCVDSIEAEFVDKAPSSTLKRMLEKKIPQMRSHVERKVSKEFGDWLVEIRVVSRNLGQLAIGQASAARQREEDLRIKQRQAEEQSRLNLRDCVYALQEEEEEDDDLLGFDLTPLYRAYHIHQTLGLEDRFKQYYFENRKLQLTSDFQVSSITPFLESHQNFFAQIAGFFIVEDRVLRTGGGLISRMEVDNLWETAVSKMCSVLEDQFSRMQTANHLLLIKDYVSLLGVTLRRYGYTVDALLDVLSKHRDKYHELLLSDCRKQIGEALAADKFEQMLMKKGVSQAMQVAANMTVLERACDFFFRHAAQLSGIPLRMAERSRRQFPLNNARDAAEEMLSGLLKQKVDGFMTLIENVNWMADEPVQSGNEYVNEVMIYLETLVSTAQQILPGQVLKRVLRDVLAHISEKIVGSLFADSVKRFSIHAVMGIEIDVKILESFADNQASLGDANDLKSALGEARQLVNLLLSSHPENFLNPVIRERSYNLLDYRKVVTISEKLKDPSDRLFGTFGSRAARPNPKKKSLDTLIKRLKDVS